jgi:iron complex transport system ATP-binding protein
MAEHLSVAGLRASYHGREVLHDVAFALTHGESVALLGPNGSGKSTLLKALTKTLTYLGSVNIDGRSLADMSYGDLAARIAFVPQDESPAFPFSVRDVIGLARIAKPGGGRSDQDRRAVDRAAELASCEALLDRKVTELSGGEHQRVLVARAIAQETACILLDEPTSHLDVRHQIEIAELLRSLVADGKTVLIAIHDLNLAAKVCERGILLDRGRIVMDSSIGDVLGSEVLDRVYGVDFERIIRDDEVLLIPRQPSQ